MELFIEWMTDKHPMYVLYQVKQVRGSRQEMILDSSFAIYMNQEVNIELLDEALRMTGKRRDNILMQNLFLLLTSTEIAAQYYFLCIVYFENMHLHALVGREDTRYQGITCLGSSRRAMVYVVDGNITGYSP